MDVTMPIRKKAKLLSTLSFISFFGSMLLTTYVNQQFGWLLLLPIVLALLLALLRCPACGKLIYERVRKVGNLSFVYYGGLDFLPTKCDRCGANFEQDAKYVHKRSGSLG